MKIVKRKIERAEYMRLDKFLAEHGAGSRTQVKELIKKGRVTVNGEKITRPERKIEKQDKICIDGKEVSGRETYYYMFYKPAGYVSACKDAEQKTVMEFFKDCDRFLELFPVGRLDKDTEGLLLVTNDGEFAHMLTSPKKHVEKTYYFESDAVLYPDAAQKMAAGILLKDGKLCKPAKLEIHKAQSCQFPEKICGRLTICEGAYHQVKRMIAACGGHVTYLKRISIGALSLDETLKKGCFRELTEDEKCQAICQSAKKI